MASPPAPHHSQSVQALLDEGLTTIPQKFIWPASLRPRSSDTLPDQHIPIIDLLDLEGDGRQNVVDAIADACREWGFFQVVNHGVPSALVESMLEVARQFFMLPTVEKMKFFSTDVMSPIRYGTSFNAFADEVFSWRDFLRHLCHPLSKYADIWPDKPSNYREVVWEFSKEVRLLALRLFNAISQSLGLESNFIEKAFGDQSQMLILNYYPRCPNPDLALGIAPHTDASGLTVLLQGDVSGLQVCHNGSWVDVKPIKNAFVINIGDQIQILSNGRYQSAQHRVLVNTSNDRISIAAGYGPSMDAVVEPAPELLDEQHPPLYQAVNYSEYWKKLYKKGLKGRAMVDSVKAQN